ncbi:DUF2279 domain-containing protein [Lewinellaceae bacterium SD302]|nr:DUF2279 domain-containing protein [Lewinellaceae bacterium SD302]
MLLPLEKTTEFWTLPTREIHVNFSFFLLATLLFTFCSPSATIFSQTNGAWLNPDPLDSLADHQHFLRPAQAFNNRRFWISAATGATLYGAATYGLYKTWYSEFERGPFQTIDDWPEWLQMDKAGHAFTAYQYARFARAGANWTGLNRKKAAWTAFGTSMLLQGTLEMLDAYSVRWGFSWSDIAANTIGASLHLGQELTWGEQRLLLKVSNTLQGPPDQVITNNNGAQSSLAYVSDLRFGTGVVERYLKDYNEQTIWLSANLKAFLPKTNLPDWLNVAAGYGAENVYGALGNNWVENGQNFLYAPTRYRQYFLSPDIYFSRIPTKKRWVRLLLGTLDFFKLPAPALEFSREGLRGHWLMW